MKTCQTTRSASRSKFPLDSIIGRNAIDFSSLVRTIFPAESLPQATRNVSAAARRLEDFKQQSDKAERDAMAQEMRGRKPTKEELATAARIKAETKEDLEGLQAKYNLIVEKLSGGGSASPEFVAEATAAINKHAARLRSNIVFPKPDEGAADPPVQIPAETRKRLRELCTRIYEFLTNPIIEHPNVLDLKAADSARKSLGLIITLSDRPSAG